MARFVYKVIMKENPKTHYRVGAFLQKISITLKKILPDSIFEYVLMSFYKL
jgi:hypothetical protein